MDKNNKILIVIAILLFFVAVGVVFSVIIGVEEASEEEIEEIEELVDKKVSEIKRPNTEGIDENLVDEILAQKNENENKNEILGSGAGIEDADQELVFVGQNSENKAKDNISKEYSDFTVEADGEKFSLSDYSGKPIVLMFWRSDVSDALETLNTLNSAYDEYSNEVNFVCVDVAIGEISTKDEVRAYLEANEIKIDMIFDTSNNNAVTAYNINYVPSVIFIDRNRNVINTKEGILSYDALEANLDLLIGKF